MRFKVGFFTARHPEIDPKGFGECYVYFQKVTVNAKSVSEAVAKAKERVDLDYMRQELTRRYPNARFINYTVQHMHRDAAKTWGRSFQSWRIIE